MDCTALNFYSKEFKIPRRRSNTGKKSLDLTPKVGLFQGVTKTRSEEEGLTYTIHRDRVHGKQSVSNTRLFFCEN